ncbi:major head protein [Gordonia phage Phendrix]|uniref:Major capsid protein n=2 Tax=Godonkavirus TaxID=2733178 RepID=A0A4D6E411_9CAUD|nr:major head protein [Gordonia phage GodonK]YP_010649118.1 major head protein [Gordonia phage Phendrix]QBZ72695.1 major capsid hexamer protein [Gordonia phage GodonK]QDK02622.1 major capsid hexamer protein [Gordonia phage Phendrix]
MSDKPTVEDVQERLKVENVVLLNAEQRKELRDDIEAVFNSAEAAEDKDTMSSMLESVTALNNYEAIIEQVSNIESKTEETEEESEESAEATEEKPEEAETEEKAETEAEETAEETSSATEEVAEKESEESAPVAETEATEAVADAAEETVETAPEEVAMAASAISGDDATNEEKKPAPRVQVVAQVGSDIKGGFTAGAEFRSLDEVNKAFINKLDAIRGVRTSEAEQRAVVSLVASIGEDRYLDHDLYANMEKIDAATGEQALVASGGYCAPLPVNYDIFGVGSSIRPVRDSLPTFAANRGGIRYIAPPVLGAYNSAISLWTAANDANPTDPTTKPVLKVACASEQTATADAVTLSLEFGNLMARAFPELVQRHNQLALIQHARFAERTLLNKISAASTKVTVEHELGATRDLLHAIARASAAYRNRHRIPRPIKLRAILPEWTRDLLREDIASNMAIENLDVSDGQLDSWFSSRGLSISWHVDDTFATQTNNTELNPFPDSIKFWVFAEGTFLFLDGGTLDLGVIRDSDLVGTNDYRTFVETFEGIAKVGIEALEVSADVAIGVNSGS